MDKVLNIYKPQGLTPLQLINQLREKFPEYQKEKIGFAGRLDPLAHGVMLLTIGEANKHREPYLGLRKLYKFSVLFGLETDSYDYLGILKSVTISPVPENLENKLNKFIKNHTGKLNLAYPPFSSKTLGGIPLFKLAKKGKLKDIDLPEREVQIYSFKLISLKTKPAEEIKNEMFKNLKRIKGYFRQQKIIRQWKDFFIQNPDKDFTLANFEVECSSGTYVRGLAHKMGQGLGCGATAYEIYRTSVGEYKIKNSLKLFFN